MSEREDIHRKERRGYPEVCTYTVKSENSYESNQQGFCFKLRIRFLS